MSACEANSQTESRDSRPPRAWLAQVFSQLEAPLVGYTRRHLRGDVETAREVVQEAFVKLCCQAWPEIEPRATAWLYRTCRNHAIDLYRREGRMSTVHSSNEIQSIADRNASSPEQLASDCEQQSRVRALVQRLPDTQQEILRLRLQSDLSYKQIAEVTGLTVTNVGYHIHQAIASLRVAMQAD